MRDDKEYLHIFLEILLFQNGTLSFWNSEVLNKKLRMDEPNL